MRKKRIVIALGHEALGTTLPEQKIATGKTAKAVADLIESDYQAGMIKRLIIGVNANLGQNRGNRLVYSPV